jgi:integrase
MKTLPFVSGYKDRHGRLRWRYRRNGVTVGLPGQPGEEAFQQAYMAALDGRTVRAEIVRHPNQALPRTLKAAWRHYAMKDHGFKQLKPSSQNLYMARAERLLAMRVADGLKWGDVPLADLKRRHVKALLNQMADKPHAAYDALVILRKIVTVGMDLEWIEVDPTHMVRYRPESGGHRSWTDAERHLFERHHAPGTLPRTVYALALYTGQRRSDLVELTWAAMAGERFTLTQQKTGKRLVLPVLRMLRDALDAVCERASDKVIHISADTLTNYWPRWTTEAGIDRGATLHGLRKTLGKLLAETGATTRELMDVLGHDAISHAELYSRGADQEAMAKTGLEKVETRLRVAWRTVRQ